MLLVSATAHFLIFAAWFFCFGCSCISKNLKQANQVAIPHGSFGKTASLQQAPSIENSFNYHGRLCE